MTTEMIEKLDLSKSSIKSLLSKDKRLKEIFNGDYI